MSGATGSARTKALGEAVRNGEAVDGCRIRLLEREACLEAEALWREVFCEDTEAFTDYYFSHKAQQNRGLVLEGNDGIRAMLYLTPEHMRIGAYEAESAYVVGVATRGKYRHRGYMAALLTTAFQMLYGEGMPFLFLMPASPDIYTPFDFTYIYEKPCWDAESLRKERLTLLGIRDAERMADFARQFLEQEKGVYVCRDHSYYITQLLELGVQNGCIYGYEEKALPDGDGTRISQQRENSADGKAADDNSQTGGRLKGLCLYTCEEGSPEITEVLADSETETRFVKREEKTEPVIMARIVHLETLLSMIKSEKPFSVILEVKDSLIRENDGIFHCQTNAGGTTVERCGQDTKPDVRVDIAELTAVLFGYRHPENEVLRRIPPFSPVWINEIV